MIAIVFKISESKKTILVGTKASKFAIGYNFAWASNPFGGEVTLKQQLNNFNPTGTAPVMDEDGAPVVHKDGSPVLRYTF